MTTEVTFKCKFTGNTVTFKEQYDIDSMRKHPEYEELSQVVSKEELPSSVEVFPVEEQPTKRTSKAAKKD